MCVHTHLVRGVFVVISFFPFIKLTPHHQELKEEGIELEHITFRDNGSILSLLLGTPLGVLSLVDEESRFPAATDSSLIRKLVANLNSEHFSSPQESQSLLFTIAHYAGNITYSVKG